MGMKQILVMMAAVVLVGCGKSSPPVKIVDPIVKEWVRMELDKYEGELTEADLQKVTGLNMVSSKITDTGLKEVANLQKLQILNLNETKVTDAGLVEVAKLQKLERIYLFDTKVTKAGVAEFYKALPKCSILGP